MDSFMELHLSPAVRKGVDEAGYRRPFPIQAQAIGPLLEGRNLIGQAKAGSGKTLAFGIPLLHSIDTSLPVIQALVLAPTRELAVQITKELIKIGSFTGVRIVTIYGGQSMNLQLDALRRGPHVVVGTPGRTIDHIKRGTLRLGSVRFAVLDEADTMLDMGFIDDVDFILGKTPNSRQLSLFSATMPSSIMRLAEKYMPQSTHIMVDQNEPSPEALEQFYARVDADKRLELLLDILSKERRGSAVIFCRTKWGTARLARELERRFMSVVSLHGDLSQNQRDHSMSLFRSGKADIMVATDVASRGIDVRQIGCVVNYDVPEDPVVYFHRVGRTARAGDPGRSYTFVTPFEEGDFARILGQAKAEIRPLRPGDEKRRHVDKGQMRHAGGRQGGRWARKGDRGARQKWRRYR
ncbi:MAG: DEAD/DEAH box helicase [archaeon]|nr:MAG: DEAD/DEAH box helicase [archaeon]